jgi:hypothetical protein
MLYVLTQYGRVVILPRARISKRWDEALDAHDWSPLTTVSSCTLSIIHWRTVGRLCARWPRRSRHSGGTQEDHSLGCLAGAWATDRQVVFLHQFHDAAEVHLDVVFLRQGLDALDRGLPIRSKQLG